MTDSHVKPGQVWADNDKRAKGRTLRVDRITHVWMAHQGLSDGKVPVAECTVLTNPGSRGAGRKVTIRLSRFRPTSTGYRLVSEPEQP